MVQGRKTPKATVRPKRQAGEGPTRSKWPWVVLALTVVFLAIPLGFFLWNYRSGTFNAWLAQHGGQRGVAVDRGTESEFAKAFGIGPEMSAEFEFKLTDGGAASQEEIARRINIFSMYIQRHLSEFNSDPHKAIRGALRDPKAFGLEEFKTPSAPR